jgi:hypothetical protein
MSIDSSEVPGPYPQQLGSDYDSDADESFDFEDVSTHEQVK